MRKEAEGGDEQSGRQAADERWVRHDSMCKRKMQKTRNELMREKEKREGRRSIMRKRSSGTERGRNRTPY